METLANDMGRFDGDVQAFVSSYATLRSDCEDLRFSMTELGNMWEGEAFEALLTRFQSDFALLESLLERVERLSQSLVYANSAYDTCENKVRDALNELDY